MVLILKIFPKENRLINNIMKSAVVNMATLNRFLLFLGALEPISQISKSIVKEIFHLSFTPKILFLCDMMIYFVPFGVVNLIESNELLNLVALSP